MSRCNFVLVLKNIHYQRPLDQCSGSPAHLLDTAADILLAGNYNCFGLKHLLCNYMNHIGFAALDTGADTSPPKQGTSPRWDKRAQLLHPSPTHLDLPETNFARPSDSWATIQNNSTFLTLFMRRRYLCTIPPV